MHTDATLSLSYLTHEFLGWEDTRWFSEDGQRSFHWVKDLFTKQIFLNPAASVLRLIL